jgi:hypothetical protein
MSRLTLLQGLLMNLEESISSSRREYLPKHVAYEQLKQRTGQDFGYDVHAWRIWLKEKTSRYEREDQE